MSHRRERGKLARDEAGKALRGGDVLQRDGREWHPTENQIKVLDFYQDSNYAATQKEMTEATEVSDTGFRNWFKTSAFVAWWNEHLDAFMGRQLPRVYAALVEEATGGNTTGRSCAAAAKIILERWDKHYAPKVRQDINLSGELKIGVGSEKFDELCDEIIARHASLPAREHEEAPRVLPQPTREA